MNTHLKGDRPLAVVTGASSGIGYELAREFAENGFDLIIVAEDAGIVEAQQAFEMHGSRVQAVRADLATYDGVEVLYQVVASAGRVPDAVAINAGVGVGGAFLETDLAAELKLISLNVASTVHIAKRLIKDMVARGAGRVLFTSSIASEMPGPWEVVYAASKAFVQSFAESLRKELSETGVTVTSLMPGPTETNFFHRAGMDDTRVGASKKDDASQVAHQGFEAMMKGREEVIAGSLKTKLMGQVAKVLPDATKAARHAKLSEPGSAPT